MIRMMPTHEKQFLKLIDFVKQSKTSIFYKDIWNNTGHIKNIRDVPPVTVNNFIETPLNDRLYKNEKLFVKIIEKEEGSFLWARTLEDIGHEMYGVTECERPLVHFDSAHESIEKSLWFYENGILPLIGESNLSITAHVATQYKIDAIVTETKTLPLICESLAKTYPLKNIENLVIIDTYFDIGFLQEYFSKTNVYLRLGLPETGVFASANLQEKSAEFHVHRNYIVEKQDKLLITKLDILPTPIIRYDTALSSSFSFKEL